MALELTSTGVSTTGLLAYYKFENAAITTDSSGNTKTLTNNNTVGSVSGLFTNSADFGTANTNKYLSRADSLGADLSSTFSVNVWVKIRTEPTAGQLWGLIDWQSTVGTARYLNVYYQYSSPNVLQLGANNSEGYVSLTGANFGTTDWHMVSVVGGATKVGLYLDGLRVAEATRGTTTTANNITNIGRVSTYYASVYLDDLSFWSRELSDVEIGALADVSQQSVILV